MALMHVDDALVGRASEQKVRIAESSYERPIHNCVDLCHGFGQQGVGLYLLDGISGV